jgi:hypothetical protein
MCLLVHFRQGLCLCVSFVTVSLCPPTCPAAADRASLPLLLSANSQPAMVSCFSLEDLV